MRKRKFRADGGHRGWKIAALFLLAVLLLGGASVFWLQAYKVAPAFSEMTCEYGEAVSRDIEDYLVGEEWSVQLGNLDLSEVDEGRTGSYQAVVRHGGSRFVYTVNIQDTVPPEIIWREGQIYLPLDDICTVDDVIWGVTDADLLAEAFFWQEGEALAEIRFDSVGSYELEILARDTSGNETRGKVSVIVDTPPKLSGIRDFYVVTGNVPDYLHGMMLTGICLIA